MSQGNSDGTGLLQRRDVLKTTGVGILGAAIPGVASAQPERRPETPAGTDEFPRSLLNPRARNAGHAWERGYRGRADRTVLLPDTGYDARHGDLGPWNDVRVSVDDGLELEGDGTLADVSPPEPGSIPELVGWLRTGDDPDLPRDTSGHGSHVGGIMQGTGRARVLDTQTLLAEWRFEDGAESVGSGESVVLSFVAPGETAEQELFTAVRGRWLDVSLVGPDGSEIATGATEVNATEHGGGSLQESDYGERAVLTADAVHDADAPEADRTYTLEVVANARSPSGAGEVRLAAASVVVERGTELAEGGSVEDAAVTGALADDGDQGVHPGVAPRQSVVATPNTFNIVTGRSEVLRTIVDNAEAFAQAFEARSINMSWGQPLGIPSALVQNQYDEVYETIAALARAGLVSAHAVANFPGTPTGGNDTVSGAPEAISVVRTDHLSGISASSSGGLATVTDDGEVFQTPDVCAYGQDETSVEAKLDTGDGEYGSVEGYVDFTGTSMAAPSTAGLAALVMQAMEEDGPDGLDLPAPSDLFEGGRTDADRLAWTLKAKAALLATTTTTAFNAIPYHGDQQPAYTPGERDPFEGFGRLNHGAAVDAVSRNLAGPPATTATLGLGVPDDEQAAAGYITGPGEYEISVAFDEYSGVDADLTNGEPHLDLVVYDALSPEGVDGDNPATGTPTIVASHRGLQSADGSVTVSLEEGDVYQVVVKLVSVPGDGASQLAGTDLEVPPTGEGLLFNGADVQVAVDLEVDRQGVGIPEEAEPEAADAVSDEADSVATDDVHESGATSLDVAER